MKHRRHDGGHFSPARLQDKPGLLYPRRFQSSFSSTDMVDTDNLSKGPAAETHSFQAEVAELLQLMVHSVYSETDIFLRELISNASDACDQLRYEAIAKPELTAGDSRFAIRIAPDAAAGTLTIADNGIGMDRQELIDNLGTIARSGTRAFVSTLAEAKDGGGLIGQFGVGFYSAFMVADRIEVTSRRAGSPEAWLWTSSGGGGFEIAPASEEQAARVPRGTEIVLHLKEDAKKYLEPHEIRHIVSTYSDHILFPIELIEPRGQVRTDQLGERTVAAAEVRTQAGGLCAGLPHHYAWLRRAGDDAALPAPRAGSPMRSCCSRRPRGRSTCSIRSARGT